MIRMGEHGVAVSNTSRAGQRGTAVSNTSCRHEEVVEVERRRVFSSIRILIGGVT